MPSQQSSFSGMRTTFTCQAAMLVMEASSEGPSKIPQPCAQAYSVPARLTPWRTTVLPRESIRWLPETAIAAGGTAAEPLNPTVHAISAVAMAIANRRSLLIASGGPALRAGKLDAEHVFQLTAPLGPGTGLLRSQGRHLVAQLGFSGQRRPDAGVDPLRAVVDKGRTAAEIVLERLRVGGDQRLAGKHRLPAGLEDGV